MEQVEFLSNVSPINSVIFGLNILSGRNLKKGLQNLQSATWKISTIILRESAAMLCVVCVMAYFIPQLPIHGAMEMEYRCRAPLQITVRVINTQVSHRMCVLQHAINILRRNENWRLFFSQNFQKGIILRCLNGKGQVLID